MYTYPTRSNTFQHISTNIILAPPLRWCAQSLCRAPGAAAWPGASPEGCAAGAAQRGGGGVSTKIWRGFLAR